MFVGVARVVIQIPGSRSLKDRRSVVRSFKDRVRARLPVSVAEVGDVEVWQLATVGVCTVSRDRLRCEEVLMRVTKIARSLADAIVTDVRSEVTSFGPGGRDLKRGLETSLDDDFGLDGEDMDGSDDDDR